MKLKPQSSLLLFLILAVTVTACQKAPTSPTEGPGAVLAPGEAPVTDARTGVTIAAPRLLTPAANKQIPNRDQPVTLTIINGVTTGSTSLTYTFEVATDAGFATKVVTKEVAEGG